MPKLHVLLKKEELDGQLLPGKVVIVLDGDAARAVAAWASW